MSTYVMSDLHGCFGSFMRMLKKIRFKDSDTLVLAGDYMDRGSQNYEMLEWLVNRPDNVIMLLGNHDKEFIEYILIMELMAKKLFFKGDNDSYKDFCRLYDLVQIKLPRYDRDVAGYFDYYDTLNNIIAEKEDGITLNKAIRWRKMLEQLPYVYKTESKGREVIVVHAGYAENVKQLEGYKKFKYEHLEDFYLHSRDESIEFGGKENAIIIAGHTPTIAEGFTYNNGRIYHYHDDEKNCDFYDVDCGAVFRPYYRNAHMACLRIDDMKEFYV